jgi:hypothetical protein
MACAQVTAPSPGNSSAVLVEIPFEHWTTFMGHNCHSQRRVAVLSFIHEFQEGAVSVVAASTAPYRDLALSE